MILLAVYIILGIGLLCFIAYWKPISILLVIVLTAEDPLIGIPTAFIGTFFIFLWLGRDDLGWKLIFDAVKVAFFVTAIALTIGLTLDVIFGGSSDYSGALTW